MTYIIQSFQKFLSCSLFESFPLMRKAVCKYILKALFILMQNFETNAKRQINRYSIFGMRQFCCTETNLC